jgi:hypothetical protein
MVGLVPHGCSRVVIQDDSPTTNLLNLWNCALKEPNRTRDVSQPTRPRHDAILS